MILNPLQSKVTENHSGLTALKDHKWNVARGSRPSDMDEDGAWEPPSPRQLCRPPVERSQGA